MNRWHNTPKQTKINAYTQIGEATGMAAHAVEKDWWVVQALAIIFEMEIGKHLVFKGGTSLSKAWRLIERFSEDIDLAVDRSFFGFKEQLSKSQRSKLRKTTCQYIEDTFYPNLQQRFKDKGLNEVVFKIIETPKSDQDPRIIEIYYPNVIPSGGYIQPRVQVEVGCRSLREPFSLKSFASLVDEQYPDAPFAQQPIAIPTVNPERTLLEMIFLLHEEFQRPKEKIRVDRLSRHLYDIYQLSVAGFAQNILNDAELYETIVCHRQVYTKVSGVNYNLHQPQTINPIPPSDIIKKWEDDYKTMQEEMIYGDSPHFDAMIEAIREYVAKLNSVTWTMKKEFPLPEKNS